MLADAGLSVVVSDTGYVKSLPPDCILEQSPAAGSHVKTGHVIYVIVNASRSPEISLPDIIDNSSLREAMAKLTAMGFKLTQPQFVPGEKDWVVGVVAGTRQLQAGDKVAVDTPITIQVGNGQLSADDSINFIDNAIDSEDFIEEGGDVDDFHEVTGEGEHEKIVE
uniref:PASTA domain-containing protein n=1 Tax=Prevotella sp. TaxID=59823 RepID=UPI00402602A5